MNHRRNVVIIGIAVAGLLVFASVAAAKKHESDSVSGSTGQGFTIRAAETNIAAVRMADLAQTKTTSPQVKGLAQRVATDHAEANKRLKQIAAKLNITFPNKMNAKDQAEYDKLSKSSGEEFDKAYIHAQERTNKTAISEYRHEADHGTEPELKQYAADTLPTLERHVQLAKTTKAAAGKSM